MVAFVVACNFICLLLIYPICFVMVLENTPTIHNLIVRTLGSCCIVSYVFLFFTFDSPVVIGSLSSVVRKSKLQSEAVRDPRGTASLASSCLLRLRSSRDSISFFCIFSLSLKSTLESCGLYLYIYFVKIHSDIRSTRAASRDRWTE